MRDAVKHIHFVGIGGVGMSGIAEVLFGLGFSISGSDTTANAHTKRLDELGVKIYLSHHADNIKNSDVVVYSSAISDNNCEWQAAIAKQIPIVPRAEMLGELMRFRKGIAVAGAHGKTTTTSLVSVVLTHGGLDPTFIIGGVVNSANTNARLGSGAFMVAEADESDASFLHLQPQMVVLTNIDRDHMETYSGSFDWLKKTYLEFLHNLPFYGLAILCFDDENIRQLSEKLTKPMSTYGFSDDVDYQVVNFSQVGTHSYFEVIRFGENVGEFCLPLPGRHNVLNALAAIAIGFKLGIDGAQIKAALAGFEGASRRFEYLGCLQTTTGIEIECVDDYAHHPSEIRATLEAAKNCWPNRRIVVVFQPHRYSRTRDLFDDFVQLFSQIENLVVTEVYSAGEKPLTGSDSRALCRAARKRGSDPIFVESFESLQTLLEKILKHQDILLTLGAGDIGRLTKSLVNSGYMVEKKQEGCVAY